MSAWYNKLSGKLDVSGRVNLHTASKFLAGVTMFENSGDSVLIIDFTNVEQAYPNGMLPILCTVDQLRAKAYTIDVIMPYDLSVLNFFKKVNWAHFLDPQEFEKADDYFDRHFVTVKYENAKDQKKIVDSFMDVALRSISLKRDLIEGLEWCVNEITDNVLNHSNSEFGGYFQAILYPSNETINFAVCDGGQGILNSLKEGYSYLNTDLQAMNEAIKQGVTRNNAVGQGNGLAGTVNVSTMTGGSFEMMSGTGRMYITGDNDSERIEMRDSQYFFGTIVSANIKSNPTDFSAEKALRLNRAKYSVPSSVLETIYERDDIDALQIKMNEESGGFGTRKSGSGLRQKVINLLESEPTYPIIIDWSGIVSISSSFADEFIGKLFLELGMLTFAARVRNVGLNNLTSGLIDKAASQRLTQAKDDKE